MNTLHPTLRPTLHTNRRQPLQWLLASLLATGLMACGGGDSPGPSMGVNADGVSTFSASALNATLRSRTIFENVSFVLKVLGVSAAEQKQRTFRALKMVGLQHKLSSYPLQTLSVAESDGLVYMREEEELAHAVYVASAARWTTVPVFANIAASESTHTAAVKTLLDRYQLADPLAGLPLGSFQAPLFQTLYAQLTAASEVSLVEALKVGVQIEELDINDIAARQASVDNADILLVYDNLLRGSRNHLRAYMKVLVQQGGSYTPQYISQATFDAIVNSPMEPGR